jgi:hypothetical protein
MNKKTALTFEEKITSAYLHYVHDVDQHIIALCFGINQGRVNEACITIRDALQEKERRNEIPQTVGLASNRT